MKVVETVKLEIYNLSAADRRQMVSMIACQRYFWNWLVGLDRPVFEARKKLWAEAIEEAKARTDDEKEAAKLAAKATKDKWPSFLTKKSGLVKQFFRS